MSLHAPPVVNRRHLLLLATAASAVPFVGIAAPRPTTGPRPAAFFDYVVRGDNAPAPVTTRENDLGF